MSEHAPIREEDVLPEDAEAQLQKQVIELVSEISPTGDYVMTLSGISAPIAEHKALEARAGLSLVEHATTLSIRPAISGGIELMGIQVPLKGQSNASLVLHRAEKLGYISAVEANGELSHERIIGTHELSHAILDAYNITPPPLSSTDKQAYSMWRSELLSRTKAWSIEERATILQQFASEETSAEVTLLREVLFSPDTGDTSVLSTIRHTISLYQDESDTLEHFHEEISTEERVNGPRTFGMLQYQETQTRDPFVINNDTITVSQRQEIALTTESYERFSDLLALTAEHIDVTEVQP